MKVKSYKDLDVWQLSMQLCDYIYDVTEQFPTREFYGLASQMRRAAVSIPSNISEGSARNGTKEFLHFLFISKGSLAELQTQSLIAERRKYINSQESENIANYIARIGMMLSKLVTSLRMPTNNDNHVNHANHVTTTVS